MSFKKLNGGVDTADYDYLDNYGYNYDFADMMNTEKLEALQDYLRGLIEIITNQ